MRPHRQQPTRLLCPWDSPGKNTGVGCHFLLQCMKVKSENEVTQSSLTLSDTKDCSLPGSSVHGIFQARVLEWGAIAFSVKYLNQTLRFQNYWFPRGIDSWRIVSGILNFVIDLASIELCALIRGLHPFIFILSKAAFPLQWQIWVAVIDSRACRA